MAETIGYAVKGGFFYKIRESDIHAAFRGTDKTWIVKNCTLEEAANRYPNELARAENLDNDPDKYEER